MLLKRLGRVATVLAAFSASLFVFSPAANAAELHDFIVNFNSQKCITVPGGLSGNVGMIQYECVFPVQDNQFWNFRDVGSGYYEIWNEQTKKCLNVAGASTAQNAAIIQYPCNRDANAEWKTIFYVRAEDDAGIVRDWYQLKNRNSGRCLTVKGASTANGTPLIQYDCNASANSKWTWY
ncbi:RICIN domain-containing protein [Actinoplanes sp. CA-030573]|uniref:RICIN domain-containing protein n=1 Tax=Actinoplanes sp. CA-030573 TaxID=3239898 RepID=UPI003D9113F4